MICHGFDVFLFISFTVCTWSPSSLNKNEQRLLEDWREAAWLFCLFGLYFPRYSSLGYLLVACTTLSEGIINALFFFCPIPLSGPSFFHYWELKHWNSSNLGHVTSTSGSGVANSTDIHREGKRVHWAAYLGCPRWGTWAEQPIISKQGSSRTSSVFVRMHINIHKKTFVMSLFVGLSIFQMGSGTLFLLIGQRKNIENNISKNCAVVNSFYTIRETPWVVD